MTIASMRLHVFPAYAGVNPVREPPFAPWIGIPRVCGGEP